MSTVVTNCKCSTEADALSKYEGLFPTSFIECVRQGCTWLANHNNLTYQTSTLVRTDSSIYSNSGSQVLKIGLIDVDKPTTGLTQYDVLSVTESKDLTNGCTIYVLKTGYKTPMGLELTLIPIKYFDPVKPDDVYTVEQVDALLKVVQKQIDALKEVSSVTEEQLNTKLADYTLITKHNQDVAVINNKIDNISTGGTVDLTNYYTKTDTDTKISEAIAAIPDTDLTDYSTTTQVEEKINTATADLITSEALDTKLSTKANISTLANYLKIADIGTQPELKGEKGDAFTYDDFTQEQLESLKGADGTSPTAEEVATVLKADEEFKASVKGETGATGSVDQDTLDTLATKTELDSYVKTETLTADYQTTAQADAKYAKSEDVYTKTDADAKFQPIAATE